MWNVYDAAPAGEKANRRERKDAEEMKGSRTWVHMRCGISREGRGLKALKHSSKGRRVAKGSCESKLKGKKCKPGTFAFL